MTHVSDIGSIIRYELYVVYATDNRYGTLWIRYILTEASNMPVLYSQNCITLCFTENQIWYMNKENLKIYFIFHTKPDHLWENTIYELSQVLKSSITTQLLCRNLLDRRYSSMSWIISGALHQSLTQIVSVQTFNLWNLWLSFLVAPLSMWIVYQIDFLTTYLIFCSVYNYIWRFWYIVFDNGVLLQLNTTLLLPVFKLMNCLITKIILFSCIRIILNRPVSSPTNFVCP